VPNPTQAGTMTAGDVSAWRKRVDAKFLIRLDPLSRCEVWQGRTNWNGYGLTSLAGRTVGAHRANWMYCRGPIPKGMHLDHTCKNRLCVNPHHLRVVTPRQNVLENSESGPAENLRKTHCEKGHPLSGDNLAVRKLANGQTDRRCKTCHAATSRSVRQRKRANA
jgi:hypothetical protein